MEENKSENNVYMYRKYMQKCNGRSIMQKKNRRKKFKKYTSIFLYKLHNTSMLITVDSQKLVLTNQYHAHMRG